MRFCIFISAEIKPDFVSRAIMWKLGCNYSHIGIGLKDEMGNLHTLFHSVGEGFSEISVGDFIAHGKRIVAVKDVPIKNADFAMGYLIGMKGKEYSESQYFGFLIPKLQKYFDNDNRKLICSEAVALFLQEHMVGEFEKIKQADFASPKDVWEAI
jgi:hypothetical protein